MIEIQLCEAFYYHELCPEIGADVIVRRMAALKNDGYDIHIRFMGVVGCWRYYVACFETEDQAAIFKLTHL